MDQAEVTPLITRGDENAKPCQKLSVCCVAVGQFVLIFLVYFSVIAMLPLSLLGCIRYYEDNYAVKVTRFGKMVSICTVRSSFFE